MPATATTEQASPRPLTDDAPSIHYDEDSSEILTTVIVSLVNGEKTITMAPLTVPLGTWTVTWNLVAGTGIESATFAQTDGIYVQDQSFPKNVTLGTPQGISDTQWQLAVQNSVMTVNSFNYTINVEATDLSTGRSDLITRVDPTIAVTQDPMT